MSDWTVHLYTAPKQIDAGDYAPCVGKPIPDVKVLDNVLTTLRYKANELRGHGLSYLHEHDGRVHIGEYGTLSEKFGGDYPYGVDGHDMNGRPDQVFLWIFGAEGYASSITRLDEAKRRLAQC